MNEMDKAKEAARKQETGDFQVRLRVARAAIIDHIKEQGNMKVNVSGHITCPVCEVGTLNFSRAGRYNGHIHAQCDTEGCVQWIE